MERYYDMKHNIGSEFSWFYKGDELFDKEGDFEEFHGSGKRQPEDYKKMSDLTDMVSKFVWPFSLRANMVE